MLDFEQSDLAGTTTSRAAVSMHYGGYENMVNTYIKTIKWVNSNGYEIDGPIAEEYMVSPIDLKNDDQFVTRIIIPVKKK